MGDPQRVIIVVAVLGGVMAAVALRRRARSVLRDVPERYGPFPRVLFFGSETCAECRPVLAALADSRIEFTQYTWETDQHVFEDLPVDEVPRLLAVDSRGRVQLDIRGPIGSGQMRQLRRFA